METNRDEIEAMKTIIYKLVMDIKLIERERDMIDVIVEKKKYVIG